MSKSTAPRPWSEAFRDVDERQVLGAITAASLRDLARALDEGAFRGDRAPDRFVCPRCERGRAEVVSEALWFCATCDEPGTRYHLAHEVACDAFASIRLARSAGVAR